MALRRWYLLYQWLRRQREAYCHESDEVLTAEQIEKLEAIGIDWLAPTERRWQRGVEAASDYYKLHGTVNVRPDYITEKGYRLGSLLNEQKRSYQRCIQTVS